MKRLLVALVVAGLLVVGLWASTASAQIVYPPGYGNQVGTSTTTYNPPGYGPGNPVGAGVGVSTTGPGALGYPSAYGAYRGYGYGVRSFGYPGYWGLAFFWDAS